MRTAEPLAGRRGASGAEALLGYDRQHVQSRVTGEAVVLCDLHEMPYEQAAQVLGCALGTVRSRLHRARELLAGKLRLTGKPRPARSETNCPSGPSPNSRQSDPRMGETVFRLTKIEPGEPASSLSKDGPAVTK